MPGSNNVLITGATGFVGRAVWPLFRGRGLRTRAALRRLPPPGAAAPGDELAVVGSLDSDTDWSRALEGVDAVVHLAGLAHIVRNPSPTQRAAYRTVNANATAALARAAARQGVRRLVFASSARVLGETSPGRPWTERDAPQPPDDYARSKWEAEQRLAEIAAATSLEVAVLRPPLIYGPGVRANFLRLLEAVARGWPLPLGALANRRSFLYVGNFADAIVSALEHPAAAGGTFLVADAEIVSTPELVARIAQALGRPARLWRVAPDLLDTAAAALGRRDDFRRLAGDFVLDTTAVHTALGWRPPYTLEQGLAETARWFRARHASSG